MTIAESVQLKKGDEVCWKVGHNAYEHGTFVKLTEMVSYGQMTFDELLAGVNPFSGKGRKVRTAVIECLNERGKTELQYIPINRLVKSY